MLSKLLEIKQNLCLNFLELAAVKYSKETYYALDQKDKSQSLHFLSKENKKKYEKT